MRYTLNRLEWLLGSRGGREREKEKGKKEMNAEKNENKTNAEASETDGDGWRGVIMSAFPPLLRSRKTQSKQIHTPNSCPGFRLGQ